MTTKPDEQVKRDEMKSLWLKHFTEDEYNTIVPDDIKANSPSLYRRETWQLTTSRWVSYLWHPVEVRKERDEWEQQMTRKLREMANKDA